MAFSNPYKPVPAQPSAPAIGGSSPGGNPANLTGSPSYSPAPGVTPQTPAPQGQSLLDQISGLWNVTQNQPSQANQALQQATTGEQIGLTGAQTDLSTQLAQQEAGFGLQGLALQNQDIGISRGTLARQTKLAPELQALTQQGLQAQTGEAERQAGLSTKSQQRGAAASGATNTVGNREQLKSIQDSLAYQLGGIGRASESSKLQFNEQMAGFGDQSKRLDVMSKQLGLSGDEIKTRLGNTIQQLGLSNAMSVNDLTLGLFQASAGQYTPIQSLLGDIMAISGLQLPNVGGGGG